MTFFSLKLKRSLEKIVKFMENNFSSLQYIFLRNHKIQQKTIKNSCRLHFSENFAKNVQITLALR